MNDPEFLENLKMLARCVDEQTKMVQLDYLSTGSEIRVPMFSNQYFDFGSFQTIRVKLFRFFGTYVGYVPFTNTLYYKGEQQCLAKENLSKTLGLLRDFAKSLNDKTKFAVVEPGRSYVEITSLKDDEKMFDWLVSDDPSLEKPEVIRKYLHLEPFFGLFVGFSDTNNTLYISRPN